MMIDDNNISSMDFEEVSNVLNRIWLIYLISNYNLGNHIIHNHLQQSSKASPILIISS